MAGRIAARFTAAMAGSGLVADTVSNAGLSGMAVPQVTHVTLGTPITLMVKVLPAQTVADFRAVDDRLAEAMGVHRIDVIERRRGTWIKVVLDAPDPLDIAVPHPQQLPDVAGLLHFGVLEDGCRLDRSMVSSTHIVIQGATGTGKSVFSYNLLGQFAGVDNVIVAGSDVSGLLLQPWAQVHPGWQALGTRSPEMHAVILERLVHEMDERIESLPQGKDQVTIGPDCPLIVAVLEEYPGLVRAARQHDQQLTSKTARKLLPRIEIAYGRLMSEARKAGIRLIIITQRADADILDGYMRGQARIRISFAVDSDDAIRMLHPKSATDMGEQHMVAPPGIALVTAPGIPIARMRAPDALDYADYCRIVLAHAVSEMDNVHELDGAA